MISEREPSAVAGLRPGDHLCVIYGTEEEHRALLTPYLRQGLERNEKVVYIVDARTSETVLGYLRDDGLDVEPYLASGQLSILSVGDAYMREGVFSPDGMISLLKAETERSEAKGYSALRVTGEMTWALRGFPGSDRLMEYEAKLNAFFPNSMAIGLCQYDMRRFEPSVLLDVLATHPFAVIGTEIYNNFYFVPPEEFLGQDRPTATLRHRLSTLQAHKRTEVERARLLERERSLRAEAETARHQVSGILESITDAFFAVDREWRITYVNKAAEPLLRKARKELLGQNLWDEFPEAVGTTFYDEYHRAVSGQVSIRFEEYYPPFDTWFEVHAFPSESGLSVYFQDISARKRVEEDLRKLSRAVEQSPASVVVTDIDGNIEYANPKFTETTGYTLEEAKGQNPRILKSGEMSPEGYKELWETITSGGEWRGELHNKRKNGELYWEWASISPIRDATGKITHFLAVKEDITPRKEAEESIKRLNERLKRRAAELIAINKELESFSYSVSHDLRAPLRSIDGFSLALLEDYEKQLDEHGKDYLRRVRAASQRMGHLIDDMLKLSRLTRSDMTRQEVDLSAMARQIVSELQRVEPAPQLDLIAEPGLVVRGDPRLLRIALENLLGNAWKFSQKVQTPRIEFGSIQKDGETAYFVRDNGVGFDMTHSGKLFGAFQRLHAADEFPGTGIGLATVQRIIHRHGGRVWAESAPGQGATFYFTL